MPELSRIEKWFVNKRGEGYFEKLLSRMKESGAVKVGNNSKILELGAGNGALSSLLYEQFHPLSITLTDFDQDQVATARKRMEDRFGRVPDVITIEQADATNLRYQNNTFDLVVAHLILHHLGKLENIFTGLGEIHRVLVPDGAFIYVEFAHKKEIRRRLGELGFNISYRKGFHRETVIATKLPSPGNLNHKITMD
ncbi:MAG: class I SAM-dependent methyltransferase [Nitrososphaerota archaeon]|jgi:ubiquinone/menaquinone biosynthesis C-methylase UbiE|nr:class I SAM-dependent methyltransferase [Nitrososphaerota archaeon]